MRDRRLLIGSLALVVAASGFGMLGPVARLAYDAGFEPMAFVAWRATIGWLAIVAIVALTNRRGDALVNPLRLPRRDVLALIVAGGAGIALNISTFVAFDLTTVALVLLAFYTYPALVAVVAVALGHERLDGSRLVALGLALGGMVLVVAGGLDPSTVARDGGASFNPVGVVLGLVAAIFQTVFVTINRGRFATMPSVQVMSWVLLMMIAVCIPLAFVLGNRLDVPLHDGRALGLALLAGIFGAGVPSVLFLIGIRAIGGTRAGILMLIEPLVGVTLAAIVLHEALLPIQVVGGAAILGAALLLQRGGPGDRPEPGLVAVAEHT
ncbi:MAG TPA: DMT family transporter [Verrucomicrobiae bacterium]|jgi:drug/metabolite transporter (DMT)-like permease|nr:DMT family transporter [Verrucomicrobiae bacterium]